MIGLSKEDAACFSFLLATPIIGPARVAALCSAATSYLSVRFLMRYFETNRLTPFAIYSVAAGIVYSAYLYVT